MFDLPAELPASVLDCCAGGSGFTAVATSMGVDAIAVDPAYDLPLDELADTVRRGTSGGAGIIDQHADDFVWDWFGSPEKRDQLRTEAADAFLADRTHQPSRYVAALLPDLPFVDGRFEPALCSHLLFTWSNEFDAAWHLAALRELKRVATEVRVFPLVVQATGAAVPFLDDVRRQLEADGIGSQMRRVPYEFQRGGNQMLVLG